ncbi:ParB family chromosome partitioning protein [Bradyrhizobium sp. USDA 4341]
MSRKDERRSMLLAPVVTTPSTPMAGAPTEERLARPRVGSGAVRAMGMSLSRFREDAAEEARSLKLALETGQTIVELDPALVDPSFIRDRIPDGEDPDLEEFKDGIKTHGQKVPILVRPHPRADGRYEAAYGHRRLKACTQLGIKVRAVIAQFSDIDLVIAQGKENSDRLDPSYIERAMYARALEEHPFERTVIMAALSVGKPTLWRLLTVAKALPIEIVAAIGPARKAGRPRWMALAKRLKKAPDGQAIIRQVVAEPRFAEADSDSRFSMLFDALAPKASGAPDATEVVPKATSATPARRSWTNAQGREVVRIEESEAATTLALDKAAAPEFGAFLIARLEALYNEFEAAVAAAKTDQ